MEAELKQKYKELPGTEGSFPEEDFMDFYSSDGLRLHTYKYPCDEPKCLLYSFHGLHAYSDYHSLIAMYMSDVGCEVLAFDQRGHGKSDGERGLICTFESILNDSIKFIEYTSSKYPGIPIYLLGSSMGASLCLLINEKMPGVIKGMILMSPAIKSRSKLESLAYHLVGKLSCLCPGMFVATFDDYGAYSNPNIRNYLLENPYVYNGGIRFGSISSVTTGMRQARELIDSLKTPFVVVQGTGDTIIDPQWSEELYNRAPAIDKQLLIYEGLPHTFVFENDIYAICEKLQQWISARIS